MNSRYPHALKQFQGNRRGDGRAGSLIECGEPFRSQPTRELLAHGASGRARGRTPRTALAGLIAALVAAAFPVAPAAAHGGDIFVGTDGSIFGDSAIGEYTTAGVVVNPALVTGLSNTYLITVSGSDLFVANFGNGTVGEYTTSGVTVNASLITGLSDPVGIAISGSDLFVTNYASGKVGEYTTSGGAVNASLITGLTDPYGIAVSGSNLFVTGYNGTVGEYTTSGGVVNASLITGLGNGPHGIALSGSDLFITSYFQAVVGEYTTSGGTVNASLITNIAGDGIALSGSDLFIANLGANTVGEYTTSGATVNAALVTGLEGDIGIAVSGNAVPEPSALLMMSVGSAALYLAFRRWSKIHEMGCF